MNLLGRTHHWLQYFRSYFDTFFLGVIPHSYYYGLLKITLNVTTLHRGWGTFFFSSGLGSTTFCMEASSSTGELRKHNTKNVSHYYNYFHFTSTSYIYLSVVYCPSCLHTTMASSKSKRSSQTVSQVSESLLYTSRRPLVGVPSTSLAVSTHSTQ